VNLPRLSLAYIRARALNSVLNVLLLGLGVATSSCCCYSRTSSNSGWSVTRRGSIWSSARKGSPLQLILSSVYHVDIPTGNIPLNDAENSRPTH